ncbi:MAG TPA: hypothetical protein PKD20_00965 [Candidatus Saccharibacteria bacterium]|jgi:hypothetical protein|nr:hypothetical protein [Candidatus Saccharibacteria bacterium]HMT55426.1 hypothetical protein [Candidatus Saccharibacteria bacterium]
MKIQIDGIWHEILGQGPTPYGVHQLYMGAEDVGRIVQAYPEEVESMYKGNGYQLGEFMLMPIGVAPRVLRHCFEMVSTRRDRGMVLGPAIVKQELWQGSLGLWHPIKSTRAL